LIRKNWKGEIDAIIIEDQDNLKFSNSDIEDLKAMIRFSKKTKISVKKGSLLENVKKYPNADVNIFSVGAQMQTVNMINIVNESRISGIFCVDSTLENVLV
jgi:predicted nucleotidyltransferase